MTACPVDSIFLDAASPRLLATFSSRSPAPFKVSWIAPPIALITELPPWVVTSGFDPLCRYNAVIQNRFAQINF